MARSLTEAYRVAYPRGCPGFILFVQTFGDLVNFNPHVHALVADGVFEPSGRFLPLPPVPEALLAERLRRDVLGLLVRREAIPPPLAAQMRVIALIEDPAVIERILSWLGLWEPRRPGRPSPPADSPSLPLTYPPVPDIA